MVGCRGRVPTSSPYLLGIGAWTNLGHAVGSLEASTAPLPRGSPHGTPVNDPDAVSSTTKAAPRHREPIDAYCRSLRAGSKRAATCTT